MTAKIVVFTGGSAYLTKDGESKHIGEVTEMKIEASEAEGRNSSPCHIYMFGGGVSGKAHLIASLLSETHPSLRVELQEKIDAISEAAERAAAGIRKMSLSMKPYYVHDIKDKHPNDDWRGKGNRRMRVKRK